MIILGPVAIAKNGVIGGDNDLPWYLPEDLKHFKEITLGHTVLMGRKTYDSIIKRLGKPLPGRVNVVITRQENFIVPPSVLVFHSIEQALGALKNDDVYVIGGAQIFAAALPAAVKMYVTHVHKEYPGDVYFPVIDWNQWVKIEEQPHEEYTFATYIKKDGRA
jgi:dihydrofolate reductase